MLALFVVVVPSLAYVALSWSEMQLELSQWRAQEDALKEKHQQNENNVDYELKRRHCFHFP